MHLRSLLSDSFRYKVDDGSNEQATVIMLILLCLRMRMRMPPLLLLRFVLIHRRQQRSSIQDAFLLLVVFVPSFLSLIIRYAILLFRYAIGRGGVYLFAWLMIESVSLHCCTFYGYSVVDFLEGRGGISIRLWPWPRSRPRRRYRIVPIDRVRLLFVAVAMDSSTST